jgi:predicted MFS family arabinose efflux permease
MFACIAPLLPHYAHEFALSKTAAGLLTGSYSAGVILGALAVGRARRLNPRTLTLLGLATFGVATLVFGLGPNVAILDLARVTQGIGCGGIWGGGLAWLAKASTPGNRGRSLGVTMGAATFGTMLGPVVGTIAAAADPRLVFGCVALVAVLLVPLVFATKAPSPSSGPTASIARWLRHRTLAVGLTVLGVPFIGGGALSVLVPLQLNRLGGTRFEVGATFFVAAAVGTLISPLAGTLSDRRGRVLPIRIGLVAGILLLVALCLFRTLPVVMILTIGYLGCVFSLGPTSTMALLTDIADRTEFEAALPAMQLMAIAVGELVGSTAGAALAQATRDAVTYAALAVLSLVALLAFRADVVGQRQTMVVEDRG